MSWVHRNCIEPVSCWQPERRPLPEECTRGDLTRTRRNLEYGPERADQSNRPTAAETAFPNHLTETVPPPKSGAFLGCGL